MKSAVIYSRVSTEDQRISGISLIEQEDRLRKYCQKNELKILEHYQDDVSAKSFNRPSFNQFIKDIKSKKIVPDVFLCVRLDRFSRNLMESLEMLRRFQEMKIEFRTVEKDYTIRTPEDYFYYVLDSTLAQVENDRRGLNTKVAMRHGLKQGRWMWRAPFGYKNIKENKSIDIDDTTAHFIKEAFDLMATGMYPAEEIRRRIRQKGFMCSKQQFLNLLRNPIYAGKILIRTWRDEVEEIVEGKHPPLITWETFTAVQDYLSGKKKIKVNSTRSLIFPLRGFLVCPKCGQNLTASSSRSRNKSLYNYYHCQTKYNCDFRMPATLAHGFLDDMLLKLTHQSKQISKVIVKQLKDGPAKNRESKIDSLNQKIESQQALIESLNRKFIADEIDKTTYSEMKKKFQEELLSMQSSRHENVHSNKSYHHSFNFLFRLCNNIYEFYKESELEVKQKLLGSIFVQNLIFDLEKVRTAKMSTSFQFITQVYKQLQNGEKLKGRQIADLLEIALPPGLEPGTL